MFRSGILLSGHVSKVGNGLERKLGISDKCYDSANLVLLERRLGEIIREQKETTGLDDAGI